MKRFNILFFLIFVFGLLSCGDTKAFKDIDYEGVLIDTIGGGPVAGVTIALNACRTGSGDQNSSCYTCSHILIGTAVTSSDGSFHIKGSAARNPIYSLSNAGSVVFNERYRCLSESGFNNELKIIYLR